MTEKPDLMEQMRKLADLCVGPDAERLRKGADELQAAVESDAKAPVLVGAWARARKLHDEIYRKTFAP